MTAHNKKSMQRLEARGQGHGRRTPHVLARRNQHAAVGTQPAVRVPPAAQLVQHIVPEALAARGRTLLDARPRALQRLRRRHPRRHPLRQTRTTAPRHRPRPRLAPTSIRLRAPPHHRAPLLPQSPQFPHPHRTLSLPPYSPHSRSLSRNPPHPEKLPSVLLPARTSSLKSRASNPDPKLWSSFRGEYSR